MLVNNGAKKIARKIREIHCVDTLPSDKYLDHLIGLTAHNYEEELSILDLIDTYGPLHRTYKGDIPYSYIRRLYEILTPYKPKSILDLGSGNGRILFYGTLLFEDIKFYGIEIVSERVHLTRTLSQKMDLDLDILNEDVMKVDLPNVDCICLMNSLFPSLMPLLLKHLKQHARNNPFIIISVSTCNIIISEQDWLQEIQLDPAPLNEYDLRLFRSII